MTACKLINALYVAVGIITILSPIFIKLVTGKLVLPYGFKLPWIDEFSFWGYAINFLHHVIQARYVVDGLIYTDGIYMIIIIHIYCVYDNLCLKLDELNQGLNQKKSSKDRKKLNVRDKLVEVIKLHQQLLK